MPKPRFSERMGLVPPVPIQLDSLNEPLQNSIWNFIRAVLPNPDSADDPFEAVRRITISFLRKPVDEIRRDYRAHPRDWLHDQYYALSWPEVYDLLEFIVENAHELSGGRTTTKEATRIANAILERENSGYHFISGELTRVADIEEVKEIERAAQRSSELGLAGVHAHISEALKHLGRRPDPDCRNAIKEAISAVEAAVKIMGETRGGGLSDALTELEKRTPLHPALKEAFVKLYGYTSDADGIRHAMLEEPNVRVDDARFMVIVCSAFVHLLISKADAAGLIKKKTT